MDLSVTLTERTSVGRGRRMGPGNIARWPSSRLHKSKVASEKFIAREKLVAVKNRNLPAAVVGEKLCWAL
jgi:hypothetical protein